MRAGPPDEVLSGTCLWRPRVTSWLGGRLLAAEIPISSGKVTGKVEDSVLEQLSITVPREAPTLSGGDVVDWRPDAYDSPLAGYGQTLDVSIIVTSVITGQVWETRIGRFQISDWDADSGTVNVKGESMIARPRDDGLGSLSSPTGTFISEVRRLMPAGIGVSFGPALTDRAVPQSLSWSTDRLKNLREIAAAWPALIRIDEWGQVVFRAPLPTVPTPLLALHGGSGGTLVSADRSDTRTKRFNEVIVSSSNADRADVQGAARVTSGPMSTTGNYGVVTRRWSSPLIEDSNQAAAAARTMLAEGIRPAQSVPVHIAPDPRLQLDDAVAVERADEAPLWGWVTGYELPLTVRDGDMRVDVGLPT